jgi:anti-anti-sigma factor
MTMLFNQKFPPPGPERRACPDQSAAAEAATSAWQPVVVRLPSEIDLANASLVHDALTLAGERGTAVVVADATETTFCDCAGVQALVRAHRQATAAGTGLRVAAAVSLAVRRIFELTGADQVLDTYPTLAAALDGPPRVPGAHSWPARASARPAAGGQAIAADFGEGMA